MKKLEVKGEVGEATIYTVSDEKIAIDEYALAQIKMLCDNEVSRNEKIRVMPDVHPAKVSTVGLTMTVGERILPSLVGIDIGCGVTMARIKKFRPEYQKIDKAIRENISTGSGIRNKIHPQAFNFKFDSFNAHVNKKRAMENLGTLGFGNHYCEIDVDDSQNYYLCVHSGSRSLGKGSSRVLFFNHKKPVEGTSRAYSICEQASDNQPLLQVYGWGYYRSSMLLVLSTSFI